MLDPKNHVCNMEESIVRNLVNDPQWMNTLNEFNAVEILL